jgi:hypothetical protein
MSTISPGVWNNPAGAYVQVKRVMRAKSTSPTASRRHWPVVCLLVLALGWVLPVHLHERALVKHDAAKGIATLTVHAHSSESTHDGDSHSAHDDDCAICHLSRTLAWPSLPPPVLGLGAPAAPNALADPDRLISTDYPAPYYGRAPPASA